MRVQMYACRTRPAVGRENVQCLADGELVRLNKRAVGVDVYI